MQAESSAPETRTPPPHLPLQRLSTGFLITASIALLVYLALVTLAHLSYADSFQFGYYGALSVGARALMSGAACFALVCAAVTRYSSQNNSVVRSRVNHQLAIALLILLMAGFFKLTPTPDGPPATNPVRVVDAGTALFYDGVLDHYGLVRLREILQSSGCDDAQGREPCYPLLKIRSTGGDIAATTLILEALQHAGVREVRAVDFCLSACASILFTKLPVRSVDTTATRVGFHAGDAATGSAFRHHFIIGRTITRPIEIGMSRHGVALAVAERLHQLGQFCILTAGNLTAIGLDTLEPGGELASPRTDHPCLCGAAKAVPYFDGRFGGTEQACSPESRRPTGVVATDSY